MSTNLVHVLTIIGKAAEEAEAVCEELLARRIPRHPNGQGSDDWSERDHKDLEQFCDTLIAASLQLPIHYYAQYLDVWTVADSRFAHLKWPDGKRRWIWGNNGGLVFYPSDFSSDLLAQIQRLRRKSFYRTQAEDRWYLEQVKEAIAAALWLEAKFLVVAFSQALGPSRQDEEIKAALEMPMQIAKRPPT